MSHQAVYDVLRALTDAGLVRRIQPPGSVARYESRVGDNHHHVVCRSCGVIADVDCAVGTAPCLTAVRRPRLRDRRGRGRLLGPVPRLLDRTPVPDQDPLSPERIPVSDSPDAVVGEMNEERGRRLPGRARARPAPDRGRRQPGLVAEPAQPEDPRQEPRRGQPAWARTSTTPRRSRPSTSPRSSRTSRTC